MYIGGLGIIMKGDIMTDEAKLRELVTEFKRRCVHNANVFKKNYDYYYEGKSDAYEKAADMLDELLNEKPAQPEPCEDVEL
jgi:hypothetical protein